MAEIPVAHPTDARSEPRCVLCGQAASGHPPGTDTFHAFAPPTRPTITVTAEPVPETTPSTESAPQ